MSRNQDDLDGNEDDVLEELDANEAVEHLTGETPIGRRTTLRLFGVVAGSFGVLGSGSVPARGASDGYGEGGFGEGAYGGSDSSLAVTSVDATNVDGTSATLVGELDALGGASSADVYFEYRQVGADTWASTATQTLSSTGTFSESVSGLAENADYEFRAVADASDGDIDTGTAVTFATSDDPAVVSTGSASDVTETSATLNGSLDDLGGASSADVAFEYRKVGASSWSSTATQTLLATGSFSDSVSGLSSGTDYEFRAVADASDGDTDAGTVVTFATESASNAPTIDRFDVSEAGSPNPHAEITVEWAVSDADADLSTVSITVVDSDGTEADSRTSSIDGSSASGTDQFKIKHGGGESYDVTLQVRDVEGNANSETKTVSS